MSFDIDGKLTDLIRSVGVIVDHVAGMYPIEIDVARAVAGGKVVADVTPEVCQ